MTREEAIKVLQSTYDDFCQYDNPDDYYAKVLEARNMAIEALQTKHSEDCVSRQRALDTFGLSEKSRKYGGDHSGYDTIMLYEVQDALEALPSVQPEPKMGKWIIIDDCERFIAKCSECGRIEDSRMISKYPYCHCGAKMQEVEE